MIAVCIDKTLTKDAYLKRTNRLMVKQGTNVYTLLINGDPFEKIDIQTCGRSVYNLIQLNNESI